MPPTIPGLDPATWPAEKAPLPNRDFEADGSNLQPEDYFVLTRIDGRTPLKQILLICGFPEPQAVTILKKLRAAGAIYFPGEPPPPKRPAAPPTEAPRAASGSVPPRAAVKVEIDEKALHEPDVELSEEQKRQVLTKHASLRLGTLFDVLEVDGTSDKTALKKAYFRLSKVYHPDRYYGKKIGSYKQRYAEIFEFLTKAFELLSDDARREDYLVNLAARRAQEVAIGSGPVPQPKSSTVPPAAKPPTNPPVGPSPQARAQAAKLFEQACQHQVTNDLPSALDEFRSAIQLDPQVRYLRRAAEAAMKAQELRYAEEYAKKAAELDPQNATTHRTLAKVHRALGRVEDARRELQLASRLDPENPHIAAELDELGPASPTAPKRG